MNTTKLAVIVGGESGIGEQTAQLFLQAGIATCIAGVDREKLHAFENKKISNSMALHVDVRMMSSIESMYAQIHKQFPQKIDYLCVNVGVVKKIPFAKVTPADFDDMMAVNLKGVFFSVQKALPFLKQGASVVLTSSYFNAMGPADLSVYAASKAAVRSLARTISRDLLSLSIRVNVVSPGLTNTPLHKGANQNMSDTMLADGLEKYAQANIPLKRMAQPDEIAKAIFFLASDASAFMLGEEITVDGGERLL